jgi:hypothetical protein
MAPTPEQERDYLAQFDKFSNEQVRQELVHGFIPGEFKASLTLYLSKREMESNSAQIEIARRASYAAERAATEAARASTAAERQAVAAERQAAEAERANTKATIALVIAIASPIITAIIAVVGIWVTHMDAHK